MNNRWFENMKLSKKMMITPAMTLCIFVFLGISGYRSISFQYGLMVDISSKAAEVEEVMADAGELRLIHANLYKILSWYNTGYDEKKIVELAEKQFRLLELLSAKLKATEYANKIGIEPLLEDYKTNMKNAVDMASTDLTLATTFVNPCETRIQEIDKLLSEIISKKRNENASAIKSASAIYNRMAMAGITSIVLSFLITGFSGYYISRSMKKAINKTIGTVESIAGGNLTISIGATSEDELGRIAKAVDMMAGTLRSLVVELHGGASSVVEESERLSNVSASLVESVGTLNAKSINVENSVADTQKSIYGIESSSQSMNSVIENLYESVNNINTSIINISESSQHAFKLTSEDAFGRIESASAIILELNESIN